MSKRIPTMKYSLKLDSIVYIREKSGEEFGWSSLEELIEYLQNILTNDADKDSLVMTSQTLHQISLLYRQYY